MILVQRLSRLFKSASLIIRLNSTANNSSDHLYGSIQTDQHDEHLLHTPVMLKEVIESLVDHKECSHFKVRTYI